MRQQIYEEYPFLHPDPEFHSRKMKPRPIVFRPQPAKPKVQPQIIKLHKIAIPDLVNCIVKEYHRDGNGRMKDLLLPCSVEFSAESSEKSSPTPPLVDMKEVQDVMDSVLDRLSEDEKMEETNQNNVKKELTETEEMVRHILVENVVTKALDESFIRGLIFKAADFAVGESFANSMSNKKQSRGGASASFLSEVPLHLIEKRRSGRYGRGGGGYGKRSGLDSNSESMLESPRGDDMTAKALIESLFPSSLLSSSPNSPNKTPCKVDNEKKSQATAASSPVKKILSPVKKEVMETTWLPSDQDDAFANKCIEECMTNSCLNSCLSDLLLRLTERLKNTYHWPRDFDQSYLNLYQCWRPHFVLPNESSSEEQDEMHEFFEAMVIANEIIIRDLTAFSVYDSDNAKAIETLTEHLWDDLQHLVLNVYNVPKTLAVRILSLHLHYYYKVKDEVNHFVF